MLFRTILLTVTGILFFITGCAHNKEASCVKHGIVCFTFDDGRYQEWLKQMDLFKRYHAKATFFYNRAITGEMAESMRILRENGHSIGLHTVHHKDCKAGMDMQKYYDEEIKPQVEAAAKYGIRNIRYFAYPNNRHTQESDLFLGKYFARFRAGIGIRKPKGYWIADENAVYIPLPEIAKRKVMGGCGIGTYYKTTVENLDAALTRAAKENKLIVFFTHGISPNAKGIDIPTELLEHLLKKASELQMQIAGFDQLPE